MQDQQPAPARARRLHFRLEDGSVSSWLILAAGLAAAAMLAATMLQTVIGTLAADVQIAAETGEVRARDAGALNRSAIGSPGTGGEVTREDGLLGKEGGSGAAATLEALAQSTLEARAQAIKVAAAGGAPGSGPAAIPPGGATTPLIGASPINTQAQDFNPIPADTYSPDRPGYHDYSTDQNLLCSASQGCTQAEMIEYLQTHAYPGQDPANPVSNGDINPVEDPRWFGGFLPGGDVVTFVSPDGMTIVNQTQEGHVFHDGTITRQLEQIDGDWYITTTGRGNNESYFGIPPGWMAGLNENQGRKLFDHIDDELADQIREDHPPRPSTSLPVPGTIPSAPGGPGPTGPGTTGPGTTGPGTTGPGSIIMPPITRPGTTGPGTTGPGGPPGTISPGGPPGTTNRPTTGPGTTGPGTTGPGGPPGTISPGGPPGTTNRPTTGPGTTGPGTTGPGTTGPGGPPGTISPGGPPGTTNRPTTGPGTTSPTTTSPTTTSPGGPPGTTSPGGPPGTTGPGGPPGTTGPPV